MAAHPVHTSHAEADYRAETQRLEVALNVFADDLLLALLRHTGRDLSYEQTPAAELDAALRDYVAAHFRVIARDGQPQILQWVGREFDRGDGERSLWLYCEFSLPGGPDGAQLHHALLQQIFKGQHNTVTLRDGPRRVTLTFAPNSEAKRISFPELDRE